MLISFDGTDSSGKETQVKLFIGKLRALGHEVLHLQTPDYETASGEKLYKLFRGLDGSWNDLPWQERMQLLAQNRAEHRDEVVAALEAGHVVVYDRYIPSSLAHMVVDSGGDRAAIHKQVRDHEEGENKMPTEDVSVFCDVPPTVSAELLSGRRTDSEDDMEEQTDDLELQQKIYNEYQWLCSNHPDHYIQIECVKEKSLRDKQDIAYEIWLKLTGKFPELQK